MTQETDTGLKVIEILKLLTKQDISGRDIEEIIYRLNKRDCTAETIQRYIHTLKYSGLNITKSGKTGKYHLENQPFSLDLNDRELKALCFLDNYVNGLNNKKLSAEFENFFNDLSKYFTEDLKQKYHKLKQNNTNRSIYSYKHLADKINIFEDLCKDKQRTEIVYENGKTYITEPKELIYDKNCVYLLCYIPSDACNKMFLIDKISSYKQLPTKSSEGTFLNTAVFECRGRLAKNYKLKPSERIINSSSDSVIISNAQEDKEVLLRRILKYGENAKVIQPKNLSEDMVKMINKMIQNCERAKE